MNYGDLGIYKNLRHILKYILNMPFPFYGAALYKGYSIRGPFMIGKSSLLAELRLTHEFQQMVRLMT